jgi:hypothetical protein
MKSVRDVLSLLQGEGLKVKNNQPILPHICATLKISENTEECMRNSRPAVLQVRNCILFTGYCFSIM